MSYFKHVQTRDIHFGKDKGKLSINIELVMSKDEFKNLFNKHYQQKIIEQAIPLNGT